jgi:hypothetical protein
MFTRNVSTLTIAFAVALALTAGAAQAQHKPFKVSGGGTVDHIPLSPGDTATHWATGQGTEIGEYYGDGIVRLDSFTSQTTGDFSSAEPFIFIAANGDELAFDYAGVVELIPAAGGKFTTKWVAIFTPVTAFCTGRFAKVTGGSFVMTAITDPFNFGDHNIGYTWSGDGSLIFGK